MKDSPRCGPYQTFGAINFQSETSFCSTDESVICKIVRPKQTIFPAGTLLAEVISILPGDFLIFTGYKLKSAVGTWTQVSLTDEEL